MSRWICGQQLSHNDGCSAHAGRPDRHPGVLAGPVAVSQAPDGQVHVWPSSSGYVSRSSRPSAASPLAAVFYDEATPETWASGMQTDHVLGRKCVISSVPILWATISDAL